MNKQLLDYMNEGLIIFNKDYKIQFCNQSISKKLKYPKKELVNEDIGKVVNEVEKIIKESEKASDISIILNDYNRRLISSRGRIFREEWLGGESYWLVIKVYSEEVTKAELEVILDNMPYSIWIADENNQYRYMNSQTRTMINGFFLKQKIENQDELVKQHPHKIYQNKIKENILEKDQEVLKKGIMINEERSTRHSEENLPYQLVKIPMFEEAQGYKGYIGIIEYSILKQKVDITKVMADTHLEDLTAQKTFYSQLVQLLEFSITASKVLQEKMLIILKYNQQKGVVEELGRLRKGENKFVSHYCLSISKEMLLEILEESTAWEVKQFEQKTGCHLESDLEEGEIHCIRINAIEYNNEFMGAIFTIYPATLQYPLMDAHIINKICQHIAIIFKSVEYSVELEKEWSRRKVLETESTTYKEALKLETLKTEFLANMSHELKTPLNIMYSVLQTFEVELKELASVHSISTSYNKLMHYEEIAKQNIYRLIRLINNITDISKIGAGYYQVKMVNCDIVKEIEDITMAVVEYFKNKELSIIFDTEIEELEMACDPKKIERIMLNLLSNAVKYTNPGGSIEVKLSIKAAQLVISVKDTGIGIPKEKQDIIFKRFAQVDTSFTRKCEGSGIGLALVKSLVEKQQGKIKVESEEGKGSTFIVTLPITRNEEALPKINIDREEQLSYKCKVEFSDIYNL